MNGAASTHGEALEVFTQCSNCNTVFELSAELLRAAGGQVRCGRCGQIFNALARLAEDAGSFDTGESPFDMEERADSILESVVAEQTLQASPDTGGPDEEYGGAEIAQLQVLDFSEIDPSIEDLAAEPAASEAYPDAALEFTLPPGELDRIFVESSNGVMPHLALVEPAPPEESEPRPDIEIVSPQPPAAGLEADDFFQSPPKPAGSVRLWSGAAVVAALLLVGQLVHHNREALTSQGPQAPLLRALYSWLGAPLGGAPDLAAFQLRQWGVTGEAGGDATLRVRASILNTSSRMQPFPLLRVTLANRYGTRIGTRDFAPGEYMGRPVARLLSPGEKVDAVLNILDPGKDAEGFEIDVCLPRGDERIACANDSAPVQARQ